ncbi:MAG: site-specific DNA-methyltransferase [Anaerolineales bacterium]|nr:site-specific DNA-methyltransferase [Anaerolineales bacterium]
MSSNGKAYGPANPHPLSQLRTELVWEGKYDEYGNRREVDVAGLSMPMQKIETIDQPRSEAAAAGQLDIFEKKTKRLDDFRNMLIWGDNKLVMASLLKNFKGRMDLIYIDPPFDVGADFTMDVPIGDESETVGKDQSTLEMVAYRDMWGKGTDSYLQMIYERLVLMRDLLAEDGSIYVHCDWRVNAYVRLALDEVFGKEQFRNEIIWFYPDSPGRPYDRFVPKHDNITRFSKSPKCIFNADAVRIPILEASKERYKTPRYLINSQGKRFEYTGGEAAENGKIPETVWQLSVVKGNSDEKAGYPTQKPEALLERIIKASSNEGDLVGDFFCGSGTTGTVAERLGRRWVMADLGRFGIHTSRKRLIDLQRTLHSDGKPYRAFDVYNLGRYERQWWQKASLQGADEEHRRVVLEFFQAETLQNAPSALIHGRKSGAFCHVDGIDSIFSRGEARAVAKAVAAAGGRECYCLAWEFEMDLRLTAAALEQELGVKLKLIQIPREIMERNRKSPPPFLEMAVLEAEAVYRGQKNDRSVDIKLTKFLPSLAEVPSKELEVLKERAVKSGFDFIDFWAVDFEWHPDKPFNHHWQDYRTRKDRSLKTVSEAGHKYPKPGSYTACVKVVDVFGCDTSITVEVKV